MTLLSTALERTSIAWIIQKYGMQLLVHALKHTISVRGTPGPDSGTLIEETRPNITATDDKEVCILIGPWEMRL